MTKFSLKKKKRKDFLIISFYSCTVSLICCVLHSFLGCTPLALMFDFKKNVFKMVYVWLFVHILFVLNRSEELVM